MCSTKESYIIYDPMYATQKEQMSVLPSVCRTEENHVVCITLCMQDRRKPCCPYDLVYVGQKEAMLSVWPSLYRTETIHVCIAHCM